MAILSKLKQKMGQVNANRPQMGAPMGGGPPSPNMGAGERGPQGLGGLPDRIRDFRNQMGNRGIGAGVPGFSPSGPPMGMPPPMPEQQPMGMAQPQMQMGQPGMGQQPQMGGMFGGYRNIAQNQQNDMQRLQQARNRFSGQQPPMFEG